MHASDSELVTAIIDGEIHRYGEVVQRFDDRVRGAIAREVTDRAAIEDLVQETFYKAFLHLDKLKEPQRLEGWLLAIARTCVADHFRKRVRAKSEQNNSELCVNSSIAQEEGSLGREWIWDEVEKLASEHGEVLRLRYRNSMTYEEIAAHLNIRESTVRGRIFEARRSLKKRLRDKGLFP